MRRMQPIAVLVPGPPPGPSSCSLRLLGENTLLEQCWPPPGASGFVLSGIPAHGVAPFPGRGPRRARRG